MVAPGRDRQESNAPWSSRTISASQIMGFGAPGNFAVQRERVSLIVSTFSRCDINRGRFSSFLQNSYTSALGRFTWSVFLISIREAVFPCGRLPCLLPTPNDEESGQFPDTPRYSR